MSDKVFTKEQWNAELEEICYVLETADANSKRSSYEFIDRLAHDTVQNCCKLIRDHIKP